MSFCSQFKLKGIAEEVCKNLANQTLTINVLYQIYQMVKGKLPLLKTGLVELIQKEVRAIVIRDSILQQLPWLTTFTLFVIILLTTQKITAGLLFGLLILVTSIVGVTISIIVIKLRLFQKSINGLLEALKTQAESNVADFERNAL